MSVSADSQIPDWRTLDEWRDRASKTVMVSAVGEYTPPEFVMLLDAVDKLKSLVLHCWVHSGYQDCGSRQMDSNMRALYRQVLDEDESREGSESVSADAP